MSFSSGAISYKRFAVVGDQPKVADQDLLDRLETHALRERDLGVPEETEYGWSGGRHVLDATFSFENNVFADALSFALRVDTNKVPGDLKKAYTVIEEEAVAKTNPSGFISKNQKRDVKDIVRRKVDDDLRSGRFRRSKLTTCLWDLPTHTLYCSASGATQEKLLEIFERTFDLSLQPLSSGTIALRTLERGGRRRDYEDCTPTRFASGPEGESQQPDYPWVTKGPEAKDFLGNEFLMWLWHELDRNDGTVKLESQIAQGEIAVMIDRSLDLDCAYAQSGKDSLRATGPARMPEALDALRTGKVPRKAGLIMESSGSTFNLAITAETLAVGGLKLPEIEEADSPRVLFEERIALLRDFSKTSDALYDTFLKLRMSGQWERTVGGIRKWIGQSARAVAAVA